MVNPAALALSRAPSVEFLPNSASAPRIATVFTLGLSADAISKKPDEKACTGSGPSGTIEKYWL